MLSGRIEIESVAVNEENRSVIKTIFSSYPFRYIENHRSIRQIACLVVALYIIF